MKTNILKWPSIAPVCLFAFLMSGCAFNVNVKRSSNEHPPTPSPFVETLRKMPAQGEAVEFARIDAQGNNWQSASDCDAKLLTSAREIGADSILIQPESSGLGQGAHCSGIAYLNAVKGH